MTSAPIFIGGTGRSGTTALQWMLGSHPTIHAVKWETQFIVAPHGLIDLLRADFNDGAIQRFLRKLRGRWFRRVMNEGLRNEYEAGLCADISEEELEAAIDVLHKASRSRLGQIARKVSSRRASATGAAFVDAVFEPALRRAGARRWSEKTPRNILYVDELRRMYPDMRFVHVIRDGRDVVASMLQRQFWPVASSRFEFPTTAPFRGEVTFEKALDYWVALLDIAREVSARVPPQNYLEVRLEDLIQDTRATTERLLTFLGEEMRPDVLSYDLSKGHVGRWREDLTPEQARAFADRAGHILEREGYAP